jgi:hypothetical protein
MLTDNRGLTEVSRGIRNNNPLNLKKGVKFAYMIENPNEKTFMTFSKSWQGIRAGVLDITNDIAKGKNNLVSLISEFAPKKENDTKNYINLLSKKLSITKDTILDRTDFNFMLKLVKAIIEVENGTINAKLITNDDVFEGVKSAFLYRGYKLPSVPKKVNTDQKTGLISLAFLIGGVLLVLKLTIK